LPPEEKKLTSKYPEDKTLGLQRQHEKRGEISIAIRTRQCWPKVYEWDKRKKEKGGHDRGNFKIIRGGGNSRFRKIGQKGWSMGTIHGKNLVKWGLKEAKR